MTRPDVRRTVEAVWRMESARIVAGLVRLAGDVSLAEDFAQDALLAALEQWEESGVPDNPGAWLSAVARRKAIDGVRRRELASKKQEEVAGELEITGSTAPPDDDLGEPGRGPKHDPGSDRPPTRAEDRPPAMRTGSRSVPSPSRTMTVGLPLRPHLRKGRRAANAAG